MQYITILSLCLLLVVPDNAIAQTVNTIQATLSWENEAREYIVYGDKTVNTWYFEGAVFDPLLPAIPQYLQTISLDGPGTVTARIVDAEWEVFTPGNDKLERSIPNDPELSATVVQERRNYQAQVRLIPMTRRQNGQYARLKQFTIRLEHRSEIRPSTFRNDEWTRNSVLEDGDIYKLGVSKSGVYKLTHDYLINTLNINLTGVDPAQIKIFGNGGGRLPESVNAERPDDLVENAIWIEGGNDGSFDQGDYILFYANSVDDWTYNPGFGTFNMTKNIYGDAHYYYLKISQGNGKRIADRNSLSGTTYISDIFDDYASLEVDRVNLLDGFINASGSGKDWYGDHFFVTRSRNYNGYFTFPGIVSNEPVHLRVRFAARRSGISQTSVLRVNVDGNTFSKTIQGVRTEDIESNYARVVTIQDSFFTTNPNLDLTIEYPDVISGTSEGWLDFIEINTTRQLLWAGAPYTFRNHRTLKKGNVQYEIGDAVTGLAVWDVTDSGEAVRQLFEFDNSAIRFGAPSDTIREFVVFDPAGSLPAPDFVEKVANQNLHGIDNIDLLIVYHPEFKQAVERLAQHRSQHSQLAVATARLDQVFNEFASGKRDPTAIRDMARMLHVRNDRFKYLLLFGDGSFDYKNLIGLEDPEQYIPPYETNNSIHPIKAFPSDDYFALLSPGEGDASLNGAVDIGVGRIPVRSPEEADVVVDKIIHYDTDPDALGSWRNLLTFVADDEDFNIHLRDADGIAEIVDGKYPVFNQNKIYCDAYQQESTPGGIFIPGVNEAINNSFFKGHLVIGYLGHGGPKGWAHERILTFNDIANWDNPDYYPLLITATCSFTGFDDPRENTAGERTLMRENGGVVALYSTMRAVFSSSNERLTRAVYNNLFEKVDGVYPPIGEILRLAKNANSADTTGITINARKFALFGDPSMHLAIPKYAVQTVLINGEAPDNSNPDTLRALQKVTVEGRVVDDLGNIIDDFNGTIIPTVFDKEVEAKTLGQDPESNPPQTFDVQKNILFKGKASVTNGQFSFSFVIPKDINYELGRGRISYYAHDGQSLDASGFTETFLIGGTDPNAANDDQGPTVDVFMNDENFVFGGITNSEPVLFVRLSDDNGINVVGNSIGHDLVAVLDGDTKNTFVLNDFYEAALDDYRKGEVRFPLHDLEAGRHEIEVTAWDVANNSSVGQTEFIVAEDEDVALKQVLNYPNPFTTHTEFMFEHNVGNAVMDVQIQIFTVSGRLVKTISQQVQTSGFRVRGIEWDGRDDYGGQLAKGIYVYKVKIGATRSDNTSLKAESDFEKLVILK